LIEPSGEFVNRKEELKAIREKLESERFELIIVYGRRRVGKTRLVLEAVRGRPHVYYLAVEGDNLRHFIDAAKRVVPELSYVKEDWEAVLHHLRDGVVLIDEFPNLVKEDPNVLSRFQRIIDLELSSSRTKLILLGSSIGMMTEKVLSHKSPLYGRRTASIKLNALNFFVLREFFPMASLKELVEVYGMTDGIPYYILRVRLPFWEWLEEELLDPTSIFRDEADFLLRYEFTEVKTYKRILEAIAMGKSTPKEIRDFTGLKHADLTPYLRNLMETGFIVRELPIMEGLSSKRGRYFVADNYLAFYFRFIYPNLSAIEEGVFSVEDIREDYNRYLGWVFEKVARQFLIELDKADELPFRFTKIGRWWRKGEEIDFVALNERQRKALFVEVKWKSLKGREARGILKDLERKAELVELESWEKSFGLVAKSVKGKERLGSEGFLIWDLDDFKSFLE